MALSSSQSHMALRTTHSASNGPNANIFFFFFRYSYVIKERSKVSLRWTCSVRKCPATRIERNGNFKKGKRDHNKHPVNDFKTEKVKIRKAVKVVGMENVSKKGSLHRSSSCSKPQQCPVMLTNIYFL